MKIWIDTHVFIWLMNGDNSISEKALSIIQNPDNEIFISDASFWEISIKIKIGKLQYLQSFENLQVYTVNNNISILPLKFEYYKQLLNLNLHHRDPFDRIIIAQSIVENLTIITIDEKFKLYEIPIIW